MKNYQNVMRFAIFIDGGFLYNVGNHYRHQNPNVMRRLNIPGLLSFIQDIVQEKIEYKCIFTEKHYFRGKIDAASARENGILYYERVVDDVLMKSGIQSHFKPLSVIDGRNTEKGIDVLLSCTALSKAYKNEYDHLVLIASDGDYAPLINFLNGTGVQTTLIHWSFTSQTQNTITSKDLLSSVYDDINMSRIILNLLKEDSQIIDQIFLSRDSTDEVEDSTLYTGYVINYDVEKMFGFINCEDFEQNIFFHMNDFYEKDNPDIPEANQILEFNVSKTDRGMKAVNVKNI
jgi:cold shock CspA family protein/uncharacterized LabA/DUF88 family protein